MRVMAFALACLVAACAPAPAVSQPQPAPVAKASALVGSHIPDFSAPLVGGGALSDETLAGKWSVVLLWGLWCEDSLADANHTAALASAIKQDPTLHFFTLHVDQRYGRWGSVEAFFAEEGVSYPVALDPQRHVARAFGISATPTYLVIDPSGTIRDVRHDLSKDASGEGGVKRFIRDIAALRREG